MRPIKNSLRLAQSLLQRSRLQRGECANFCDVEGHGNAIPSTKSPPKRRMRPRYPFIRCGTWAGFNEVASKEANAPPALESRYFPAIASTKSPPNRRMRRAISPGSLQVEWLQRSRLQRGECAQMLVGGFLRPHIASTKSPPKRRMRLLAKHLEGGCVGASTKSPPKRRMRLVRDMLFPQDNLLQRSRLQRGECAIRRKDDPPRHQSFNEVASKEANAPASYQVFVTFVKNRQLREPHPLIWMTCGL